MSKPFHLYPSDKLPLGFKYPDGLTHFATTGNYPDIYPWWFIDANSKAGELSYSNRIKENQVLIPFAKVDDDRNDIACFEGTDTSGNPKVVMRVLDDSGREYSYRNFEEWLKAAEVDANRWK
jgi:hypothetical protein